MYGPPPSAARTREVNMPCDGERKEFSEVSDRYIAKLRQYKELTDDNKAVKDMKKLNALGDELEKLQHEMKAKNQKLIECMRAT
jgi:hypothetical protein